MHRRDDPSPRYQARLGEDADGSIGAEITKTDRQTASEEIIGDPDTENETIAHAEDAELELERREQRNQLQAGAKVFCNPLPY